MRIFHYVNNMSTTPVLPVLSVIWKLYVREVTWNEKNINNNSNRLHTHL